MQYIYYNVHWYIQIIGRCDTTRSKKEDGEFTKANVKKGTNKIISKIAIDEEKFVYELIEDVFREKYPKYFPPKVQNSKVTA